LTEDGDEWLNIKFGEIVTLERVNGGAKPGQCGGVKAGQRQRRFQSGREDFASAWIDSLSGLVLLRR